MSAPNRKRTVLAFAALLIAGAIAALVYPWPSSGPGDGAETPEKLVIEALGRGREWQFTYAGDDAVLGSEDDVKTRRHFRLPAGAQVELRLRSDDYIYVFSCPSLGLKEIAVPDLEYQLEFRAGVRGEHDLAMDPMCGFRLPPGQNMGSLSVVSGREFRSWYAQLDSS